MRWRDPDGRQRWQSFKAKSEAHAFAKTVDYEQVATPLVRIRSRVTFADFANDWASRQVWRPATRRQVDGQLRRYLLPAFGSRPLSSIQRRDVQIWVGDLSDKLAPATVRLVNDKLRSIFAEAVRDRLLYENPARDVRLPQLARKLPKIPTGEQVAALREGLPEHLRILVDVGSGSGLRIGELLGLTVDRVDFTGQTIVVDRQRDAIGADLFAPTKSRASVRTIPVPQRLLDTISEHVDRHGVGPCGLLITDGSREAMQRWTFKTDWQQAARAAGLPPGSGPHCLRHFYASLLIRSGCSVKVVQSALGHATAAETLDTYSHLWPDDGDRTRAAVAALWSGH